MIRNYRNGFFPSTGSIPPNVKKLARKKMKKAIAYMKTTMENGAGYYADEELRRFLFEYNNRFFQHGMKSLPLSYNVFSSFYRFDKNLLMFMMREEKDHLFSFVDFIEYVTGVDAPKDVVNSAYALDEGVVYSFNLYDDPHELTFSSGEQEYTLGSVSYVRHGEEVSMLMVAGKIADLEKASVTLDSVSFHPSKPFLRDMNMESRAVGLGDHTDIQKIIIGMRFDLKGPTTQIRWVGVDLDNNYLVLTDDPAGFDESLSEIKFEEHMASMEARIREYDTIFELSRTCLFLRDYFDFKYTLIKNESRKTKYGKKKESLSEKIKADAAPLNSKVVLRRVSALRVIREDKFVIARQVTPPQFQVEVQGYWRRISPDSVGTGPDGKVFRGRTWVKAHLRWRDRPKKPKEILVKSVLSAARSIVQKGGVK